jgi:hypothetical protein
VSGRISQSLPEPFGRGCIGAKESCCNLQKPLAGASGSLSCGPVGSPGLSLLGPIKGDKRRAAARRTLEYLTADPVDSFPESWRTCLSLIVAPCAADFLTRLLARP